MSDMKMGYVKPKVGEWWICNLVSVMGNGDSKSAYKMTPALIEACNVLPIERLYTQKDNDRMVEENEIFRGKFEIFSEVLSLVEIGEVLSPRQAGMLNSEIKQLLNKND